MSRTLAALAAMAALAAPLAAAEEHLVSPQAAQQRLLDSTAARARDLAAVEGFVASPEGSAALAAVGLDAEGVRGQLGRLTDAELQEVAARAAALQADPVAGAPFSQNQIIWIAAIALAVVLLIILIS